METITFGGVSTPIPMKPRGEMWFVSRTINLCHLRNLRINMPVPVPCSEGSLMHDIFSLMPAR